MPRYTNISQPPNDLPAIITRQVAPGISSLLPLSRRGRGPGMIILVDDGSEHVQTSVKGIPSVFIKWAEEGYTVVGIAESALVNKENALKQAVEALFKCEECTPREKVGVIAYGAKLWNTVAPILDSFPQIVAVSVYADIAERSGLAASPVDTVRHLGGKAQGKAERGSALTEYYYEAASSYKFAVPFQSFFAYRLEAISHTRNLEFLKPRIGGPYFDLEGIWEEHTYYEFVDRSVEHTMSTMVQEPYVNHVPTLTGGIGRGLLSKFYRDNFIFLNSQDTEMEIISRTIGIDRVIDEFIFKFTHDRKLDWLLPGVPPTHRKVEVPFTSVVNIRGDRLYHEHIAWDQGTVLKQLGLLPEYLPFPYDVDGKPAGHGQGFEYKVPVLGLETAEKMKDNHSVESNGMFSYAVREVPL